MHGFAARDARTCETSGMQTKRIGLDPNQGVLARQPATTVSANAVHAALQPVDRLAGTASDHFETHLVELARTPFAARPHREKCAGHRPAAGIKQRSNGFKRRADARFGLELSEVQGERIARLCHGPRITIC